MKRVKVCLYWRVAENEVADGLIRIVAGEAGVAQADGIRIAGDTRN